MTPFPERRKLNGFFHWPKDGERVARGTRFGNPYRVEDVGSNEEAVRLFREDLFAGRLKISVGDVRTKLKGRHLYCFCDLDETCHADLLLEVANHEPE